MLLTALLSALLSLAPSLIGSAKTVEVPARNEVTVPVEAATSGPRPDDPAIVGADDPNRPLVVIDAGHGGRDSGATATDNGRAEKEITLELARAIRDELVRSGKMRVALTRDGDRFIELRERFEIARRLGAELFVSVHADAAPLSDEARGATVYTLSEVASDREAALLASGENQSDVIGGVNLRGRNADVNMILIDLAQRESMNVSADFARLLMREASPFFPFRPDPHRFASFIVLKAPDIPSVLFETGYLTNPHDSAYIQSPEGQQQIATGMRRAIETHFATRMMRQAQRLARLASR
jgi:N-acetylmuramoyl-L-alanine amidase